MRCREKKRRRRRRKDGEWHILSNTGFLYPRDTFCVTTGARKRRNKGPRRWWDEKDRGEEEATCSAPFPAREEENMLCVTVYVCWMHKCIIRHH